MPDHDKLARALHSIANQIDLPSPPGTDYDALSDDERRVWNDFAARLDTMMESRWAKPKNEAVGDGSPNPPPPQGSK